MRNYLIVGSLLLVSACVTRTELIPIDYQFVDIPTERRIKIHYINNSRKLICMSYENWPNSSGAFDQASDKVLLIIGDERFPIEDFNTGYCFDCGTRVAPGEQVSASISYKDFNLPDRLIGEPKRLEFSPVGTKCRAKK